MVIRAFVAHGGTPFQVLINHSLCGFGCGFRPQDIEQFLQKLHATKRNCATTF